MHLYGSECMLDAKNVSENKTPVPEHKGQPISIIMQPLFPKEEKNLIVSLVPTGLIFILNPRGRLGRCERLSWSSLVPYRCVRQNSDSPHGCTVTRICRTSAGLPSARNTGKCQRSELFSSCPHRTDARNLFNRAQLSFQYDNIHYLPAYLLLT